MGYLKENFFDKFAARKQKAYMRNGLTKPRVLGVKQMASRLLVLNSYLSRFPEPENKSFSTGDMIEIVLCMIPKDWITSMAKAGMEPRTMTFQALVDHLVTLESTDATSSTTTSKETGASGGHNKKHKTDKPGKGRKFQEKNYDGSPKIKGKKHCDMCKLFKPNSGAYKTHNTTECKSQAYYKKKYGFGQDQTTRNYDNEQKKKQSYARKAQKEAIAKAVKKALKKRDAGYISSDSDSSASS